MNIKDKLNNLLAMIPCEALKNPPAKVAVLPLRGVIGQGGRMRSGSINLAALKDSIEKAFKTRGVKAVALCINSPGGSPVQSELIFQKILSESARTGIPVYSFAEDVAASGGYWLACAGEEIYVHESSVLGSIGVIAAGFGLDEFIKRHGIERRLYTSGESKAILDPFLPEKPEDVVRLQSVQQDIHENFKNRVRERRGGKLAQEHEEELFSGAFWSGRRAVLLGIADHVGGMEAVMREKLGEKTKFVELSPEKGWFKEKLGLRLGASRQEDWVHDVLNALEAKLHWARFGF